MAHIYEKPPQHIAEEVEQLNKILDGLLPSKQLDRNVLIATWNIRAFGGLTEKWEAKETDTPKRDLHALLCIANILSRFDIIALQEVKGDLKALRHTLKFLGAHWSFILTDVCKGDEGNNERLAFLFDTRKVKLSGLACELVIPNEQVTNIKAGAFARQFARTPYAVSFKVANKTFILITLHVLYGKKAADRTPELMAIAEWLKDWSMNIHAFDQSLILLGDFNIDRKGDERYQALVSTGLTVPSDLHELRRTVYDDNAKFYDQIAWFENVKHIPQISLKYNAGGVFDFAPHVYLNRKYNPSQISWRISDHLPLWAEFLTLD
ncbi:MAG TPA: endonuclease/exonuclease/phosphatase family protein [Cyclobacteriaceae bacterium]|nr:endonuclease/exonuclease/phosphatase family protein [Cyclobacteriaceae bacterium]